MNDLGKKISEILEDISPSGIFQDRNRLYNGQPWTDDGIRGKALVQGLTMRDIADCLRIAIWESAGSPENAASIYDCDLSSVDAIAVEQNLTCNIEKMMGIFPNVAPLEYIGDHIPMIELNEDDLPEPGEEST